MTMMMMMMMKKKKKKMIMIMMMKKMCSSSSSVLLVSLCLLLCLPPCLSSDVSVALKVKPGEDATLQCHSSGKAEVARIQWTRPDLKLEGYIFIYRDGRVHEESQHPSYRGRVDLKDPEMKNGNVSVILKNVTYNDTGTYECLVGNKGNKPELISNITLTVQDSVSQPALGVEVKVYEGEESVLLPCQVTVSDPQFNAVTWSVERLSDRIVHQRAQSGDKLEDQNQNYRGRTSMKTVALTTGNLSLTLRNPTTRDSDIYTCIYRERGVDQSRQEVHLKVTEPPTPPWVIPVAVLSFLVGAAVGAAVGLYMKRDGVIVQQVEVKEREESVLLPFRSTDTWWVKMKMCFITSRGDLPEDIRVEWMDRVNRKVHVYQNGSVEQDQVYRGRTKMKKDLMTGDFSLILNHPTVTDSGRYTCRVYNKDGGGGFLRETIVDLKVTDQQVEVEEGKESVQLSFKTKADLSEDVTVEWTDEDNRKVHVYRNGSVEQHQVYRGRTEMKNDLKKTGDFSLILKKPRDTDTGRYTCRIYDKDRDLLRGTIVDLKVKVQQVEVEEGVKFVLLSFQTKADLSEDVIVEWMDDDNRKVYVYQKGSVEQDQVYRGRTEMNEDWMKTGDFSLKLTEPTVRDTGRYYCRIYNKDRVFLRETRVDLKVKEKKKPSPPGTELTPLMVCMIRVDQSE